MCFLTLARLMNPRLSRAVFLVNVLAVFAWPVQLRCAPVAANSVQNTREALQKLVGHPPDPCEIGIDDDVVKYSREAFRQTVQFVSDALNETSLGSAAQRASAALMKVEAMSAEANTKWPAENRFHFQVLDVAPVLVVKMSLGTIETFYIFAIHEKDSFEPFRKWHEAGTDELAYGDKEPMRSWMDVFPLQRGPSGRARFLAHASFTGCAGSLGVEYEAHEWDAEYGIYNEILKQEGAFGMDEAADGRHPTAKDPFAPIGKLKVNGPTVQLPYCTWSPIDFWDNPSLCALDTYDFSRDSVRFISRAWNRPELVPIARALEYAAKREYPATLSYCASPSVAHRMVREVPDISAAENPKVSRISTGKLKVEFVGSCRFELVERRGRWLISAYRQE